jgi:hypothetical protein
VPTELVEAMGAGKRPPVVVTINAHTWRTRIASMGGRFLIGMSAANRTAARIAEGDVVQVELALDNEPRVVEVPEDLAAALNADPTIRAAFDALSYTHRREHARSVAEAKTQPTRDRRIAKVIDSLRER